jgi:hypothetical protein
VDSAPAGTARPVRKPAHFPGNSVYWSWCSPRNIGDWITPYLSEKLSGRRPRHRRPDRLDPGERVLFGAGGILRHRHRQGVAVVWGSGIIAATDRFAAPPRTPAVRRPLTRARMRALGYPCPAVYGDPGLLLPRAQPPRSGVQHRIGLIPHFAELAEVAARPRPDGWSLIDVTRPVEELADAIAACERTVSSSLHRIVVSPAYGVPCAWVAAGARLHGDGTKFLDHYAALGRPAPRPTFWEDVTPSGLKALDFVTEEVGALQDRLLAACPFLAPGETAS